MFQTYHWSLALYCVIDNKNNLGTLMAKQDRLTESRHIWNNFDINSTVQKSLFFPFAQSRKLAKVMKISNNYKSERNVMFKVFY